MSGQTNTLLMACCQEARDFTSYLVSADPCGGLDNEVAVHSLPCLPHLWEEIVDGVESYGNRSGIPRVGQRAMEVERSG